VKADIKADIAQVVRSMEFTAIGPDGSISRHGMCLFRALSGCAVLNVLSIPNRLTVGGMVYRAGPDEIRDCIAFCGPQNAGCFSPADEFLGHYWIITGNELIDFSVGDWRRESDLLYSQADEALEPVQWTAPPLPDFWWDGQRAFTQPPGQHTPPLGSAWYTSRFRTNDRDRDKARLDAGINEVKSVVQEATGYIRVVTESLKLRERLIKSPRPSAPDELH
jgi:hypothetical protein